MPILINSINALILDYYTTNNNRVNSLNSSIGIEDYVNLNGFIAYLQNFSKVTTIENVESPMSFGLKNQFNTSTIILEISY